MAQSEIRAGRAYVQLTAKDKLTKGLENAKKKLHTFGSSVSAIGKKIVGVGAVVGGALTATAAYFTSVGDKFDKMSGRTGASVEWLSQMAFAAQQSGTSIQAVQGAVKEMNKRFGEAQRGQGEMLKGLEMLGMSAKQLQGLTPQQMFETLSDKIATVGDQAKRTKIIDAMFGGGGNQLQNLFGKMSGNIQKLRAQADKLGLTISTQDAKSAAELSDAWGRLVAMAKMMVFQIGGALAPTLKEIADYIKTVGTVVLNWVKQNKATVAMIAKITVGVIAVGGALVVLGGIISGIGTVIGAVSTIISAFGAVLAVLTSPITLIIGAVVGLGVVIAQQTGAMAQAVEYLTGVWGNLKDYMAETWQGVKDAFQGGDLKLAVKILWLSIKAAWLQGIKPLTETWIGFKSLLADGWTNLWYGMADVFSACFYGLKDGWSATVYWLLNAFNATVNGLTVAWNSVTAFLTEAWSSTVNGIAKVWNKVMGTLMKAWVKLKGLFSDKVNVDVEIAKIDNEINAKNSALDDETASVVRRNQQRAQQQRQARQREKQATQQSRNAERAENQRARNADKKRYEQQRQAELQANMNYYADQMGQANQAIEQAKAERKALLDQAKKKAEQARAKKKNEAQARKATVAKSVAEVKGSVKGSFYADAISGVKTNTDQKRTADGVQQLVSETKKTNDLLRKNSGNSSSGSLVFG